MSRRNIFFAILIVLLLAAIAFYQYVIPPILHGAVIDPPKAMPDFSLESTKGQANLSNTQGKITLVFFGYTHCKDVCPITLAKLSQALKTLGDKAVDVHVVFISVDYKRDTPQIVSEYASKFQSDFIGLAGSKEQIDQVTRDYGIYYKLGDPDATGNYDVEHTAIIMGLDNQGRLQMTWSPDQQPDEIGSDIGVMLR